MHVARERRLRIRQFRLRHQHGGGQRDGTLAFGLRGQHLRQMRHRLFGREGDDQRLAIDIEALQGHIDASAGDNIFIASQNHDMLIDQVTSGTNNGSSVAADIRVKSGKGLYQAPSSPTYNVGSTKDVNLILEAVATNIGTSSAIVATARRHSARRAGGESAVPA